MKRVIFNGEELGVEELHRHERFRRARAPITAVGSGLPDEEAAYVFAARSDFEAWAADTAVADKVDVITRKVSRLLRRKGHFTTRDERKIRARNDEMKASLKRHARRSGEPLTSPELLQRWIEENPVEGELVDPFVGWERANYAGGWIFPCCASPLMHDWNDRLSSIMMISAVGMFSEHSWWGGAKLWLFGVPFFGFPDLSSFAVRPGQNWDKRISSYALFGG